MWGQGFNGKLFGFILLDWFGGIMIYLLFLVVGCKYMVFVVMCLVMLIKIICKCYLDDIINVVGYSQGILLILLVYVFFKDDGVVLVDGVIMFNLFYGLFEFFNEKFQGWSSQQIREVWLVMFKGIFEFICG